MWINTCGPVDARLDFLGTPKSGVYLLKGDRYALIGGAGPWSVAELERQLAELRVDLERIRCVVISHSHFDHCGAVPYLKKRMPHLEVLGSPGAARLLGMEKAVRNMTAFLAEAAALAGAPSEVHGIGLGFEPFRLDRELADGDQVDLGGGVRLAAFETPGHSRCALMVYEPNLRCLFPGDALHFPSLADGELVFTASESFTVYQESLRRVADLPVSICAWEHHGAKTGDDAARAVREGMAFTEAYWRWVRGTVAREGGPDAAAEVVASDWLGRAQFTFLPERVMIHIARGIVANAVAEEL